MVFAIGLSLYPTAINYMAGSAASTTYGQWQNWVVAFFTLGVVTVLNHFGKGIWKLASILIGMIAGYLFSIPFGMVNFTSVGQAGMIQIPSLATFPDWVTTIFGKSPVVLATIIAVILNVILPKNPERK